MMWTSKLGATGKPLVLGLLVSGELVDFEDLTTPTLFMRKKHAEPLTTLQFAVTAYTDTLNDPPAYNAQVLFNFDDIQEGEYLAEIVAEIGETIVSFPDDSYLTLRFLRGT
jgi:hypothetical protein